MTDFHPLRFLHTLFTILYCITIAGAAAQEVHKECVFEKTSVLGCEKIFRLD